MVSPTEAIDDLAFYRAAILGWCLAFFALRSPGGWGMTFDPQEQS